MSQSLAVLNGRLGLIGCFLAADTAVQIAFPLAAKQLGLTALTYVTVPAAGMLFFHESLSLVRAGGIALILAGV